MKAARNARALALRRGQPQPWPLLAIGLTTLLACAAAHAQATPGVVPSLPSAPGPNRGVPPLPNGSTPDTGTGIAPPAPSTPGVGVLIPPPVDPGMTVHRPAPGGPMPVIRPQSVEPNGTVVVPK